VISLHRDFYLMAHKRQTFLHWWYLKATVPASEGPQTCALDRAATGTGLAMIVLESVLKYFILCILLLNTL
jgi:hypothetical protein